MMNAKWKESEMTTFRFAIVALFAVGVVLILTEPRQRPVSTNPGAHNYASCNVILQYCVIT